MNAFFYGLVVALHVVICLILVVVVLLQEGKGDGGIGGAFGGGSQTVFGSRGPANFFHYLTTGSAMLFIFTSLFLSCTPAPGSKNTTVIDDTPTPVVSGTPATGMTSTSGGAVLKPAGSPSPLQMPTTKPMATPKPAVSATASPK